MSALLIAAVLAAALVVVLVRTRFWPNGRCPACRGRKGRGIGSTDQAFSRCRRCGGSGEQVRLLARIWPQHRETARKRKQDRERSRR
jgi:hypothetical protein